MKVSTYSSYGSGGLELDILRKNENDVSLALFNVFLPSSKSN